MEREQVEVGSWVEIQTTLLGPHERAAGVPDDTMTKPLVMRVRGWLVEAVAGTGDVVTIATFAGRDVVGELINTTPRHEHGFGRTDPDLLATGRALREFASRNPPSAQEAE